MELILIDDGSTDNTRAICERYLSINENIFYYYQSHMGVSAARHVGLMKSRARYISFIDADD